MLPIWITRLPSGLELLVYLPLTAAPQISRSVNVFEHGRVLLQHTHTHRTMGITISKNMGCVVPLLADHWEGPLSVRI